LAKFVTQRGTFFFGRKTILTFNSSARIVFVKPLAVQTSRRMKISSLPMSLTRDSSVVVVRSLLVVALILLLLMSMKMTMMRVVVSRHPLMEHMESSTMRLHSQECWSRS